MSEWQWWCGDHNEGVTEFHLEFYPTCVVFEVRTG